MPPPIPPLAKFSPDHQSPRPKPSPLADARNASTSTASAGRRPEPTQTAAAEADNHRASDARAPVPCSAPALSDRRTTAPPSRSAPPTALAQQSRPSSPVARPHHPAAAAAQLRHATATPGASTAKATPALTPSRACRQIADRNPRGRKPEDGRFRNAEEGGRSGNYEIDWLG